MRQDHCRYVLPPMDIDSNLIFNWNYILLLGRQRVFIPKFHMPISMENIRALIVPITVVGSAVSDRTVAVCLTVVATVHQYHQLIGEVDLLYVARSSVGFTIDRNGGPIASAQMQVLSIAIVDIVADPVRCFGGGTGEFTVPVGHSFVVGIAPDAKVAIHILIASGKIPA